MPQADKIVLVDFWATWCGPCKLVLPSVKAIAQEYSDVLKVVKVEADPNPDLMEKYKVPGAPLVSPYSCVGATRVGVMEMSSTFCS